MDISLQIDQADWQVVFVISQGTILEKGRHGIYKKLTEAAGLMEARLCCYAWGTKDVIHYCGSVARDYSRGNYRSNLHGRVHNYLQNHRTKPSGNINTNLMVFRNIADQLQTQDVYLYQLTLNSIKIGNEEVTYQQYANDPDLIHAVEQLLIAHYKRKGQCEWNRTPSSKPAAEIARTETGARLRQSGLADQIREYVFENIIQPARERGETTVRVRAGDIHKTMGLIQRMPSVCQALDADQFYELSNATLVNRYGPTKGSNAEWVLGI